MSINTILKAFTNVIPPKCFNCCCKDTENYCWLLQTRVDPDGKPDNCPLVVKKEFKPVLGTPEVGEPWGKPTDTSKHKRLGEWRMESKE